MEREPDFRRLLRKTTIGLLIVAALVAFCYRFVDRPVAYYVHDHGIDGDVELKWLTYPPPILQAWAPVVLAALAVRRAWGPFRRWERALLAASAAMIVADQFRESIAYAFGRDWPETWLDDNPSLIRDGAYGFHPFAGGATFGSFPSGHMARTGAVAAVLWYAFPRSRWFCVLASTAVAVGLVGMNYHFVSDVIAGLFVGSVVGIYALLLIDRDDVKRSESVV